MGRKIDCAAIGDKVDRQDTKMNDNVELTLSESMWARLPENFFRGAKASAQRSSCVGNASESINRLKKMLDDKVISLDEGFGHFKRNLAVFVDNKRTVAGVVCPACKCHCNVRDDPR